MATSYSGDAALTQHHPRIVTTVSNSQEIYQSGDGGLRVFAALVCEKGEEGIQLITSPSELIAKTGEINAAKYGQAANNVQRWLQAGGEALVMRVLPENATFAHAFLDIQTKFLKEEGGPLEARKVITTSTSNNVKKLLENELMDAKIPDTADGYAHNVIALFTPKGRGAYYNNIGFRITLSKQFDNVMNSRLYNIEVVKFKNNNLIDIIEGPFLVSFNPEALSPINQESIFIEDILNKYSKELSCKVNVDNFINLAKLINSEAYPFIVDPIFGQSRVLNGKTETLGTIEIDDVTYDKDVHYNLLKQNSDGSVKKDIYGDVIPNFVDESLNENIKALNYQNEIVDEQKKFREYYISKMILAVRDVASVEENKYTDKVSELIASEQKTTEKLIETLAYADLILSDDKLQEVYQVVSGIGAAKSDVVSKEAAINLAFEKLDNIKAGLQETASIITASREEYEKIDRYVLLYNDLISLAEENSIDIKDYNKDIDPEIKNIKDIITLEIDKKGSMDKILAPANSINESKSIYDLVKFLETTLNQKKTDLASDTGVSEAIASAFSEINTKVGSPTKPSEAEARAKLAARRVQFNQKVERNYTFSSNNIFRLSGGGEGDLIDKNGNIDENVVKGLLVSAYSGALDDKLTDKRATVFNFILDANYPVEVKDTIANFAENVRRDFIFIADCKIQADPEQTLTFRRDEFKVDSNLVAIYGQAVVVYDEFTGKDRQFTMPYLLASKLPALQTSVGLHYPIAGNKRGVITGFKSINYLPNDSYQELLYTNRINYAISDNKRTKLNSQLTSGYSRTPLSDLNNVITMLNIRRDAEGIAEGYQFELADSDTMRLMQQEMNETLNKYVVANAADSIACTVSASDYDLQNHVIRVSIAIKFKDIIETVLITLEVTR